MILSGLHYIDIHVAKHPGCKFETYWAGPRLPYFLMLAQPTISCFRSVAAHRRAPTRMAAAASAAAAVFSILITSASPPPLQSKVSFHLGRPPASRNRTRQSPSRDRRRGGGDAGGQPGVPRREGPHPGEKDVSREES